MFVATVILSVALAGVVTSSGIGKLTRHPYIVGSLTGVGVPLRWFPPLAIAELAGAVGLVVGLWIPALGIAAGVGLVMYFIGAVATHLRQGDRNIVRPALILAIAIAATALRIATI